MNTPATPLTKLPRALAEMSPDGNAPSYYQCYMAALNGRFRTEMQGRRYFVRDEDLPAIAETFGIRPPVAA